jgi:hypothetical protein
MSEQQFQHQQTQFQIDPEVLKIYRDYTYERANIYYLKEVLGKPGPWTTDPILKKYKFTNIRRELDRQSKFLIESVLNRPDISDDNKALHCALFRCINHNEGVARLQWPLDIMSLKEEDFQGIYEYEKAHNVGIMQSNAYFLSGTRSSSYRLAPEFRNSNTGVLKFIWANRVEILRAFHEKESAKKAVDILSNIKAIGGPFMRYQIWVDFTYIPGYHFHENEYVISGPGCSRGINWMLFGNQQVRARKKPLKDSSTYLCDMWMYTKYPNNSYEDFIEWFRDNLPELMRDNGLEWDPKVFQHFCPEDKQDWNSMQIENSFCELNKLMKLRNNISMRIRKY